MAVTAAIEAVMPQLQRAQMLHQQGRSAEAWSVLAPLRSAIDTHGQALRLYALVAQAAGRIEDAIDALKRIISIEREPPDIVGALADLLGRAGRHSEALPLWEKLVASHPELADAHLNRAITAANAGDHELAVKSADEGLRRFPGHVRLLATRAMALKNAGRIEEAVEAFDTAVAANPNRPLTRYNQGVTLRAACRFEEACEAYSVAERLGMKGAQFYTTWAAAAVEAGRLDEAEALYDRALKAESDNDEAQRGLTRLKIEFHGGEGAFAHYERAAQDQPANPKAWFAWSKALVANRRMAAALEVAERGLAANPASQELMAARAFARGMTGDASAALDELDSLLRGQPKIAPLQSIITQIAFRAGRPDRAAEVLERQTAEDPGDQIAWSLLGLAWRMLDDPREHWLCDYDRLVMITEVTPLDGPTSAVDYAREIAAALDPLHLAKSEPGDQSLRGGTQSSGSLFARMDPAIRRFRDAVRVAAEKAVAELPDDPTHPFLRRKSTHLGFSGSWTVRLAAGGHHVSHCHPEGWMSSAYYSRLPPVTEAERARHEGWIQFGCAPPHLGIELSPRRIVEPQPGRLVLFPSYMWHGTIPFASGDRLTAAFDYQPL